MSVVTANLLYVVLAGSVIVPDSIAAHNAALQYWQALAHAPKWETLSGKEKEYLQHWDTARLDKGAKELIAKFHLSLTCLKRGAQDVACEWGVSQELLERAYDAPLTHLAGTYQLARGACLHARLLHAEGNDEAALSECVIVLKLSRHVDHTGVAIARPFARGIDAMGIRCLCSMLIEIKRLELLRKLRMEIRGLAPYRELSSLLRTEKRIWVQWAKCQGTKGVAALIVEVGRSKGIEKEQLEEFSRVLSSQEMSTLCTSIESRFEEAARIASMPLEECARAEDKWKTRIKDEVRLKNSPVQDMLALLILPSVAEMRRSEAAVDAMRCMLIAALTRMIDGQAAFEVVKDPFGKGPFTCRPTKNGFELSCSLKSHKGEQITLLIGRLE